MLTASTDLAISYRNRITRLLPSSADARASHCTVPVHYAYYMHIFAANCVLRVEPLYVLHALHRPSQSVFHAIGGSVCAHCMLPRYSPNSLSDDAKGLW